MRVGVYPGSFDPVTLGHLDIIERGAKIVDKLIVGVLLNGMKNPMFTVEQRIELLKEATKHLTNVEIRPFKGLLVDFLKQEGATGVIRGLRAVTDFEYEIQIAQTNHRLNPNVDTVFLTTSTEYAYLSSSIVKEIASYGGDISQFVPEVIIDTIYNKIRSKKQDR